MTKTIGDEVTGLRECALDILVGEQLGGGSTRRVYALNHNPDLVIKVEYASRQFCNVAEYELWQELKGTSSSVFFAPVVSIDVWGGALIMKRTKPITEREFIREVKELPAFLDDTHWANFGRYKGRIVCHDYGYHGLIEKARGARLKKVIHL